MEGECVDGEELRIHLPTEDEINKSVIVKRETGFSKLGLFHLNAKLTCFNICQNRDGDGLPTISIITDLYSEISLQRECRVC